MKKKVMSLLLCLCMALTLLPVCASAETAEYGLWVGGVQADAATVNITGTGITGSVTWNNDSKTLTLDNATITGACDFGTGSGFSGTFDKAGIYYKLHTSGSVLTINLIGNNTIVGQSGSVSSYGIYAAEAGLKFTGDGSLAVSAAQGSTTNETSWSVAIYAGNNVEVGASCKITATCGEARQRSAPVYCNTLTLDSSTKAVIGQSATSNALYTSASDLSGMKYMYIGSDATPNNSGTSTTPTTPTVTITYANGNAVTSPKVGETLKANVTGADGETVSYRWYRVVGAAAYDFIGEKTTSNVYTLTNADVGPGIGVYVYTGNDTAPKAVCELQKNIVSDDTTPNPDSNNTTTGGGHRVMYHAQVEEKADSPKTADAGLMLYGILTVSSLMGLGYTGKKKFR